MPSTLDRTVVIENALVRYDGTVRAALAQLGSSAQAAASASPFQVGYTLPAPSERLSRLFAASELAFADLGDHRGKRLTLLDLTRNPRTRTTKTCASLVIVARAVDHVQRTGERVMIVSPSSGNKATALRDAVLRAFEVGLVTPEELSILVVVPHSSRGKMWASTLTDDPALRARNPVVTYEGEQRADVKELAQGLVSRYSADIYDQHGVRLWYTLNIDNYKVADVVRACAENEFLPGVERLHVHAVSSAYGLLGHDLGTRLLAGSGSSAPSAHYFLVQHLDTPDMVLSLYFDSVSRTHLPAYRVDPETGLFMQDGDPRFPTTTFDPAENLDPTFYTRQPVTSAEINELIRTRGGGGIVVSLHECLQRYPRLRTLLRGAGIGLPADPRELREWSLVMAMTGILNAIDRGLVPEDDILVHGSGSYQTADFGPIPAPWLSPVTGLDELVAVARTAVTGGPGHS